MNRTLNLKKFIQHIFFSFRDIFMRGRLSPLGGKKYPLPRRIHFAFSWNRVSGGMKYFCGVGVGGRLYKGAISFRDTGNDRHSKTIYISCATFTLHQLMFARLYWLYHTSAWVLCVLSLSNSSQMWWFS